MKIITTKKAKDLLKKLKKAKAGAENARWVSFTITLNLPEAFSGLEPEDFPDGDGKECVKKCSAIYALAKLAKETSLELSGWLDNKIKQLEGLL